jgi:uncharacterized membrane protein YdjX (TVP38/TMEM64 family)
MPWAGASAGTSILYALARLLLEKRVQQLAGCVAEGQPAVPNPDGMDA